MRTASAKLLKDVYISDQKYHSTGDIIDGVIYGNCGNETFSADVIPGVGAWLDFIIGEEVEITRTGGEF